MDSNFELKNFSDVFKLIFIAMAGITILIVLLITLFLLNSPNKQGSWKNKNFFHKEKFLSHWPPCISVAQPGVPPAEAYVYNGATD